MGKRIVHVKLRNVWHMTMYVLSWDSKKTHRLGRYTWEWSLWSNNSTLDMGETNQGRNRRMRRQESPWLSYALIWRTLFSPLKANSFWGNAFTSWIMTSFIHVLKSLAQSHFKNVSLICNVLLTSRQSLQCVIWSWQGWSPWQVSILLYEWSTSQLKQEEKQKILENNA